MRGRILGLRKVAIRLPGKGTSNSYGTRPVHQIISTIKWIRTSRLSIKNSLSLSDWPASPPSHTDPNPGVQYDFFFFSWLWRQVHKLNVFWRQLHKINVPRGKCSRAKCFRGAQCQFAILPRHPHSKFVYTFTFHRYGPPIK